MITADPNTPLGHWCRQVDEMLPGMRLDVSMHALQDIHGYYHNGAHFTPADRILGNIVGSAYTHSFQVHPYTQTITFARHEETGRRYYTDPDRR